MAEKGSCEVNSCAFRTSIGGQALIEGVLMRGPDKQAIAVRDPGGEIIVKVEERRFTKENYPILGLPFIRGIVIFVGSLIQGVKALMYSADFFPEEEAEPSGFEKWLNEKLGDAKMEKLVIGASVVLSMCLTVGLFFLLPTFLAGLVDPYLNSVVVHNLIEGVVKIVIFFLYLILCSKQKDIYRVFQYHGAEHKTIFCYERGLPLTPENAAKMPKHHPRCGTSFLFVVLVVSILVTSVVFTYVEWRNLWVRMGMHLLLLPVVIGITYEFNRSVGAHDNRLTRLLSAPGMWLQNFTTNEPDLSMLEVAIASVLPVIPEEKGRDAW